MMWALTFPSTVAAVRPSGSLSQSMPGNATIYTLYSTLEVLVFERSGNGAVVSSSVPVRVLD